MKVRTIFSVLLIFTLFSSGPGLTGQGQSASARRLSIMSGRVFDRNGAVVVGSEVLLTGDQGTKFGAVTNDEGIYSVELPAGFYNLQIWANGFSIFSLECYQIASEGRMNLDVTLKVKDESGCESGPCKESSKPKPQVKKRKTMIIE